MSQRIIDPRLFDLYDRYCHGDIDRRQFLRQAGAVAAGLSGAAALIDSLMPAYAEAQTISFTDPRMRAEYVSYASPRGSGTMRGYLVQPLGDATLPAPGVLVIHENRGLNPYVEDVARRLAVEGFVALAPDALSPLGGYPGNDDRGRELQRQIDPEQLQEDMLASALFLMNHKLCTGRIGATGFCWGGSMVNTLAVLLGDKLGAGAPFYGGAPASEDVAAIRAPLLIHYAEDDPRVNASQPAFREALVAADATFEMHEYAGTRHGFHNNSTPRYDEAAAELAWTRTLEFFRTHLG